MREVTIIGSGVVGLSCAYYLMKEGCSVRVIDQNEKSELDNCSFGNAGMIVPSHFTPLAAPGVITKGLKWMFDKSSPFYIKPRLRQDLLNWLWKFYRHSTEKHVSNSAQLLHELNAQSKVLYQQIHNEEGFDFELKEKGLMMLFKTEKCAREERELAEKAMEVGIEATYLNAEEANQMQGANLDVLGAVLFSGDAHLNPNLFMKNMQAFLEKSGVQFEYGIRVEGFRSRGGKVEKIKTNDCEFYTSDLVIASGAWSGELVKSLGLKLPLQGGKGYSFNVHQPEVNLEIPSIFCEAKVAVTPFDQRIRFAGTMEIEGLTLQKNENRIGSIKNSIQHYLPDFNMAQIDTSQAWAGLRPCSPDGIPYIGKGNQDNLYIASGHAMMGMSLGPISGKLIAEQITGKKPSISPEPLSPLRFN